MTLFMLIGTSSFKMAARYIDCSANAPRNITNKSVSCTSDCKCGTLMQNEVQALDKEVKLICEAVNSLKNELNYECVNKGSR